jgi:hypothetical protein
MHNRHCGVLNGADGAIAPSSCSPPTSSSCQRPISFVVYAYFMAVRHVFLGAGLLIFTSAHACMHACNVYSTVTNVSLKTSNS